MQTYNKQKKCVKRKLRLVQKIAIEKGLDSTLLHELNYIINYKKIANKKKNTKLIVAGVACLVALVISISFLNSILSARCLLASNYLVWEATRPLADCTYCANVTKPIVLRNITRRGFAPYTYFPGPIIVKNAIGHWRATKQFDFHFFKQLYEGTEGSYESLEDGCQFLNFKTDLFSLKEVFDMPESRVRNQPGEKPWYVGWGNCHRDILSKVRQYYSVPDFLPEDAEYPATENIFFGYEIGAVMHLDYISRVMWQGQVRGHKQWSVAPVPECEHLCNSFHYYVEPGDVGRATVYVPSAKMVGGDSFIESRTELNACYTVGTNILIIGQRYTRKQDGSLSLSLGAVLLVANGVAGVSLTRVTPPHHFR